MYQRADFILREHMWMPVSCVIYNQRQTNEPGMGERMFKNWRTELTATVVIGRKSNVTPPIIFIVLLSLSRTRLSLWVTRLKDCVYIDEVSPVCHITCWFINTLTL